MSVVNPTVEYRDIKGFPGYRVGNDGSVWSCWKRLSRGYPHGTTCVLSDKWKRLRPKATCENRNYRAVTLCRSKKYYPRSVHCLVLTCFIGPCPPGMECRHLNGMPSDNRLSNLAWGTRLENAHDRKLHGRMSIGVKRYNAKLTDALVVALREDHSRGEMTYEELARKYGLSAMTAWKAAKGKTWKHIP